MVSEGLIEASGKGKNPWRKIRPRLMQQVLRTSLSVGARLLWIELASNWAWNDPVCYPSQDVLALGLGTHRNSVTKWMNELVEAQMVLREKVNREYRYTLAEEVPAALIEEEWKLSNQELTQRGKAKRPARRNSKNRTDDAVRSHAHKTGMETHEDEKPVTQKVEAMHKICDWGPGPMHKICACEPFSCTKYVHATRRMKEEKQDELEKDKQDELKQECELEIRTSKVGGSVTPGTSRFALGGEADKPDRANEISELMDEEDEISPKSNRNKRKRRGASPDLVSGVSRPKLPFPEAIGASVSDDQINYDKGPEGIPVWDAEIVLQLLSDEVEEKFGPKGSRGFPDSLTSKLTGQIDKTVIQKHKPDVVRDMIRLLVWDWETARGVCFPFRRDQKYPDPLSFVQYAKELASRIETGFSRDSAQRGGVNSYRDLFLEKKEREDDDNPY